MVHLQVIWSKIFLTIFARVLAELQQGILAENTDFFHSDNNKKRSQRITEWDIIYIRNEVS